MNNKQRVRRIKNLIYAFIILVMFLPLILMSVLSFQMFGAIKDLNAKVDELSKFTESQTAAQAPTKSSSPDGGLVPSPDNQSLNPSDILEPEDFSAGENQTSKDENEADNQSLNKETLGVDSNDGSHGSVIPAGDGLSPADGGTELGGGAPIESSQDEYLAAAGVGASSPAQEAETGAEAGSGSKASSDARTQGELATNPQMGYGNDATPEDSTSNPSTGS